MDEQQPVESEAHPNSADSVTTDLETPSLPVTSDGQSVVESTALKAESVASLMETVEPVPTAVTHNEAPPSSAMQTQATPRKTYSKPVQVNYILKGRGDVISLSLTVLCSSNKLCCQHH